MLNPCRLIHSLCASIRSWQFSSPLSTIHWSRGFFVSGQAQHGFNFFFSSFGLSVSDEALSDTAVCEDIVLQNSGNFRTFSLSSQSWKRGKESQKCACVKEFPPQAKMADVWIWFRRMAIKPWQISLWPEWPKDLLQYQVHIRNTCLQRSSRVMAFLGPLSGNENVYLARFIEWMIDGMMPIQTASCHLRPSLDRFFRAAGCVLS